MQRLGINQFYGAPTAIRLLLKYEESWVKKYDRSSLKTLGSGETLDQCPLHNNLPMSTQLILPDEWNNWSTALYAIELHCCNSITNSKSVALRIMETWLGSSDSCQCYNDLNKQFISEFLAIAIITFIGQHAHKSYQFKAFHIFIIIVLLRKYSISKKVAHYLNNTECLCLEYISQYLKLALSVPRAGCTVLNVPVFLQWGSLSITRHGSGSTTWWEMEDAP